jgi:NADP-dependent aldehyde dehydrogenase
MVAMAIQRAAGAFEIPAGVFGHIHGASFETGRQLVMHPFTKAVGFTGSFSGGKQLFDWANQRTVPIPVFAEMGSTNPVFLFPEKLATSAAEMAAALSGSITLGVGQFCTNPGIIIGVESEALNIFTNELGAAIKAMAPGTMLHQGIAAAYSTNKENALNQPQVELVATSEKIPAELQGAPAIATVTGRVFLNNPQLHKEVFGPYSLVVRCQDMNEMNEIAQQLEGQLSATIMAHENEAREYAELVDIIGSICGRYVFNGVPTGVEVCRSMQHGGPYPATTDSRFTSVGADGIKRFARPVAFQNWPQSLLPDELKNENPLGIWRMVNDEWGNGSIQ